MTYYYDLDTLEELARELGFHPSRTSPDELRVPILDGVLAFQNLRPKEETLAGFVNARARLINLRTALELFTQESSDGLDNRKRENASRRGLQLSRS